LGEWFRGWSLLSWRSAVVAILVVYTVVGFFVVPPIVKSVVIDLVDERLGREATIEQVKSNPCTLSLTVRGFKLPDCPGTTLFSFDELSANAQLSSLFRWALTLKELRVHSPSSALRRFADGRINVVELAEEAERRAAAAGDVARHATDGDGLPRIVVQHILVDGAVFDVQDDSREEPVAIELGPSVLELHDISTIPLRRGENEFAIGLKEGGTIRVSGEVAIDPLGFDGDLMIDAMLLERTWPLLQPYFEFDLQGGSASGSLHYAVHLDNDRLHARVDDLDYRLTDLKLALRGSDVRILDVGEVVIADGHVSWPEGDIGAAEIKVEEATTW
jgi:hypothetical protein